MSNGNDWADPDELGGLSRAGNVLQSMGYDPDEVRASPALRAEVMGKLGSPYSQGSATPPATNQPSGTPAGVRDQGPVMAALDTANAAPGPRAMTPMPNASMQRPAMALAAQSTASAQPPRPGQTPQPTQAAAAPVAMPKPSQTTGQSSSQVSPTGTASSPAQDVPETLSLGLEGVRGALAAGKQASDVATELQNASAPDTSGIDTKISGESATTPYYDPKTGKIAESAKQAGYEPGVGTGILRGLRGGVVGLLTGGIPGAVVGAIEPQDIAGGTAYGAPDRAYHATEATRQNTLATDQAQRAATLQEFKDQTDRRKGLTGTLRDVSTSYNDAAKTANDLMKTQQGAGNLEFHETAAGPMMINRQTGEAQPVMANGQPVGPKVQLKESQPIMGPDNKPHTYMLDDKGNKVMDLGVHYERPMNVNVGMGGAAPAMPGSTTGEEFLKTLNPNMAGVVRAIGEGREAPPTASSRSPQAQAILQAVNRAYPGYDAAQFPTYAATRRAFTSGTTGQAINSFNTALQHLNRLEQHIPDNTYFSTVNAAENALTPSGSQRGRQLAAYDADATAVSNEVSKAYKGGVITKEEFDHMSKLLNRNAAPANLRANIQEFRGLLQGKLASYQQQWESAMPPGAVSPLSTIMGGAGAASGGGVSGAPAAGGDGWFNQHPKAQ